MTYVLLRSGSEPLGYPFTRLALPPFARIIWAEGCAGAMMSALPKDFKASVTVPAMDANKQLLSSSASHVLVWPAEAAVRPLGRYDGNAVGPAKETE